MIINITRFRLLPLMILILSLALVLAACEVEGGELDTVDGDAPAIDEVQDDELGAVEPSQDDPFIAPVNEDLDPALVPGPVQIDQDPDGPRADFEMEGALEFPVQVVTVTSGYWTGADPSPADQDFEIRLTNTAEEDQYEVELYFVLDDSIEPGTYEVAMLTVNESGEQQRPEEVAVGLLPVITELNEAQPIAITTIEGEMLLEDASLVGVSGAFNLVMSTPNGDIGLTGTLQNVTLPGLTGADADPEVDESEREVDPSAGATLEAAD